MRQDLWYNVRQVKEKKTCPSGAFRVRQDGVRKRRTFVPASVEDEVRDKIRRLKLPRDISVRSALVYDGELAPELEENNYFDFLVPAARLFD